MTLQLGISDAGHHRMGGQNATTRALATCRSMRSERVSMPCRISQAVCGLMHAPKSRSPRGARRNAPTVEVSSNTMPWKPS